MSSQSPTSAAMTPQTCTASRTLAWVQPQYDLPKHEALPDCGR